MSKKASLFSWLIQVVVWSRVLCSEVYLVGSENTHICEASFSADKRCCWRREVLIEGAVNGDPQDGERGLAQHKKQDPRLEGMLKVRI